MTGAATASEDRVHVAALRFVDGAPHEIVLTGSRIAASTGLLPPTRLLSTVAFEPFHPTATSTCSTPTTGEPDRTDDTA
ncbi:hypothetical protein [Saccharothrix sp. HUAS TT1]|uniref:hypothetical protein n=1 Tax=unclassified Saccharothrix TaxID=2593673 RepID=UPI00345C086C